MSSTPLVSVYMPVYNAEPFLDESIKSILQQSFADFEFIIVDDGSTDGSREAALALGAGDKRVRVVGLPQNQGAAVASNVALALSEGKYLARMDADDISLPSRLAKQVAYLEAHPGVGILGGGIRYMDDRGKLGAIAPSLGGGLALRWRFLFESPFYNPTVVIRKDLLDRLRLRFDASLIHSGEDYELFTRLLPATTGENLLDVLLYYRVRAGSLTSSHASIGMVQGIDFAARTVTSYLSNAPVSEQDARDWLMAMKGVPASAKRDRAKLMPVYFALWDAFSEKHAGEPGLEQIRRQAMAWAARFLLYPPFQPGVSRALGLLSRRDPLWFLRLLEQIPYFLARRSADPAALWRTVVDTRGRSGPR